VDGELGRVGPRKQIHGAHEVEELLVAHPGAAPDHFLTHERDVRRRAAEAQRPQLQEEKGDVAQSLGGRLDA
jgi:hypothetical protein